MPRKEPLRLGNIFLHIVVVISSFELRGSCDFMLHDIISGQDKQQVVQ